MMKEMTIHEWEKRNHSQSKEARNHPLIDVRSPLEYAEGHIPGAINIPLFTNEERALIGTIYKREGADQAKWKAMELVSPKIPGLLQSLKSHTQADSQPLIYCWRGGSRSGAFTTFAHLAGLDVARLKGGYRAYREWCTAVLNENLVKDKLPILLHGMTGVGKTEILRRLEAQHPVLDLELLANHRGSIFGQIGYHSAHNQKTFESLLLERLITLKDATYLIMEAESKRIGKAVQPDFLLNWRKNGLHLILHTPLAFRVQMILQEYVLPYAGEAWFQEKAIEAFNQIRKRLKPAEQTEAERLLEQQLYEAFIQFMLEHYYDPRYQFHSSEYEGEKIELTYSTIDEAVDKINRIVSVKEVGYAFR